VNEIYVPNSLYFLITCFVSFFFPESISAIVNKMANFKRSNFAS